MQHSSIIYYLGAFADLFLQVWQATKIQKERASRTNLRQEEARVGLSIQHLKRAGGIEALLKDASLVCAVAGCASLVSINIEEAVQLIPFTEDTANLCHPLLLLSCMRTHIQMCDFHQ
ncbi:hypothetical protein SLEP1_g11299 [Rubroshorea leprosula]|uniref:Uncharacterized protein n=1 Tax=Rubroshorea leprosula TaxID=152421 RepID=A0AAV5IFD5_9ROSI|nr:hypothetical protein SLEP1_g11299 [Rubroshorea leprosula]